MPGSPGQPGGQLVGADRAGSGRDAAIAADGQHVADRLASQFGTQAGVGAVDLVTGHPAGRHSGSQAPG